MAKLTPAALKKLTNNVMTAAALHDAGVTLVPVLPDGSLADLALVAFIDAGQPPGDGFFAYNGDDYKLVTPDAWERNRHAKAGPAKFDPINGEPLNDTALAAYTALAPIKVLGGSTVPAIELIAYGAEMKLLPTDLTSREARRFFTSGTDAVQPPEDLKAAARAWPYDKDAPELARRRLDRGVPATPPLGRRLRDGSPDGGQTGINHGPVGQQLNVSGSPASRLSDLFVVLFGEDELRRFFNQRGLGNSLPGSGVALVTLAYEGADLLRRSGCIDAGLFNDLLVARPGQQQRIQAVRNTFGV